MKEKILIVEDDKNICAFMSTVLDADGYDVLTAATGTEAYSMITSHCPDLVLLGLLCRNAGRVLTYDFLLQELWGPAAKGSNQILRVNLANIRRKLEANPAEPRYIFTETGVGYRMADGEQE